MRLSSTLSLQYVSCQRPGIAIAHGGPTLLLVAVNDSISPNEVAKSARRHPDSLVHPVTLKSNRIVVEKRSAPESPGQRFENAGGAKRSGEQPLTTVILYQLDIAK